MKSILGSLGADDFLRDYWQQRPLLIRDALTEYRSPVTPNELAGLATDEHVESRLITGGGSEPWTLQYGPFPDEAFSKLPDANWTLLVQAVDLWVPEVGRLLEYFDFLPRWRLDDIMVSFAPVGGSVGPHFDQYDVFLLQVEGQRNWQIGDPCDATSALVPEIPVKVLAEFTPREEWLLSPGNMLYLPPGIAHWGVALSDCLTFSIGFRSPTIADMLGDLATELMVQDSVPHYRDPPSMTTDMASDLIDPAFVEQVRQLLHEALDDEELMSDWFARYMTAPKYPGLETETGEARTARTRFHRYRNGERGAGETS